MKQILVIGDAMLDVMRAGASTRTSPESPTCQIVEEEITEYGLGGAANVAAWLAQGTGASVILLAHFGLDADSMEFSRLCKWMNITLTEDLMRHSDEEERFLMTRKERICQIDPEGQIPVRHLVRIDQDTEAVLSATELRRVQHWLKSKMDAVVVADYRKGVFLGYEGRLLCGGLKGYRSAMDASVPLFVNSKRPDEWEGNRADFLLFNRLEAHTAWSDISNAAMVKQTEAVHKVMTQGADGVIHYPSCRHSPTQATEVYDVTGAGDAFLAGMVAHFLKLRKPMAELNEGDVEEMIEFGQLWAKECCSQRGCGVPKTRVELRHA